MVSTFSSFPAECRAGHDRANLHTLYAGHFVGFSGQRRYTGNKTNEWSR
jgi:hypothetical protein